MSVQPVIDLNADVGEGGAWDAELFASGISSANIACGAHAGDAATMAAACALAARHGVAAGAHPGFEDRENFGRREVVIDAEGVSRLIARQLRALAVHAAGAGPRIRHVKPHGALYHVLDREPELARAFLVAVFAEAPRAAIFGPPAGALREAAERHGVEFVAEGFIDRGYRSDGTLVPRGEAGAVLHDEAAAVAQALALADSGRVRTLCVHGDGPDATRLLRAAREALTRAGYRIRSPGPA